MAMEDYWDDVQSSVYDAQGIAFDGCHKIYLLMDDRQVELMREYEYEFVVTRSDDFITTAEMYELLKNWFEGSCSLKFIQAVTSVDEGVDPNEGFETLIPQGAEQDEECEDCYERGCKGVCMDYDDEDEEDDE